MILTQLVEESSHGTKVLRMERWKELPLNIPGQDEQATLVEFLDRETAKMDVLVDRKERLIEMLLTMRMALIDTTIRDGERVPVTRLSAVATVVSGYPFDSSHFNRDEGTPIIRIRDLLQGCTETYFAGQEVPSAIVDDGEILIGMDGDFTVGLWRGGRALLNQRLCSVRPHGVIDRRFLYYALFRPLRVAADLAALTTVKHISSGEIRRLRIPLPSLEEQRRSVACLDSGTSRLDALIAAVEKTRSKLSEYRAALITAAVTGKIDVRDEVAA